MTIKRTYTTEELRQRRKRIEAGGDWLDRVSSKEWLYIVGTLAAFFLFLGVFLCR